MSSQILDIRSFADQDLVEAPHSADCTIAVLAKDPAEHCLDGAGPRRDALYVLSQWQQQLRAHAERRQTDLLGEEYFDTLNHLAHRYPISSEAFIVVAGSVGLFSDEPIKHYPNIDSLCRSNLRRFCKRDYIVRYAAEGDIDRLCELEKLCWQHTRTPKQRIRARLQKYPQGQFVLERAGRVLGVIYSQRIADVDALDEANATNVHRLHDDAGANIQLLAINVDPDAQNFGYGDQLLEFMLQRCGLVAGVDRVVAVTLCKDFDASGAHSMDRYIELQGNEQDAVLAFHQTHGATILKSVPGYRPQDRANGGQGVLVTYDIRHREPRSKQGDVVVANRVGTMRPQQLEQFVHDSVTDLLGVDSREFHVDRPLMEMGLDSADLLKLQLKVEERLGCRLQAGFFFEFNSTRKVTDRLLTLVKFDANGERRMPENDDDSDGRGSSSRKARSLDTDIAIIGMSCKLPGGIETPDQLWQTLVGATSVVGSFPESRGRWPDSSDMPGIDKGGFVSDADAFDAAFFRMSPAEAVVTDPQQRMLLQLAWACLEDAGTVPAALQGTKTGVFVGASNCDYSRLTQAAGLEVQAHHGVGSSLAILANRLSYFFDCSGPSLLIDTACSSSLVALHSAVQSLRSGECTTALVGGVNLICHPDLSIAYHKAGMLAADGRCKTFDATANGYVRSEGAVMMLLKPLKQAVEDHDRIHAVIKGSATNHGGLAGGLTVPNPQKQSELLRAAWKDAGVAARDLTYIEAHGTGTSLGDPIEIQGIQTAYGDEAAGRTCAIGSVKSNLGHLEPAAGIAGLLKIVLCMRNGQLPPSLNFSRLNPKIRLEGTPFQVQERLGPWAAERRVAGVSSFGSGGANAHVVVAEYSSGTSADTAGQEHLFVLSAANDERLRTYAAEVMQWLNSAAADVSFADAIHTWQVGRTSMKARLAIRVADAADLRARLSSWLAGAENPVNVWSGTADSGATGLGRVWQGKAGQRLIEEALREWDIEQLAELWTSGIEIDWRRGHKSARAKVSLPTYPFAKDRYWVTNDVTHSPTARVGSGSAILHPLLHANTSELFQHGYSSTFSGDEFFLADHRVNLGERGSERVMPAVAYLEMARAAVERAQPTRPEASLLELRDVEWTQPLIVDGQKQVSIKLAPQGDDEIECKVTSQDDGHETAHCIGRASFCTDPMPAKLDLQQLKAEMAGARVDATRIYDALATMGLLYGPSHRSITALYRSERQQVVELALPPAAGRDFQLHPSLMDGALQAAICLSIDLDRVPSRAAMPFALESLRIIGPCTEKMCALVRYASGSNAGDIVKKFDIDLCDEQGNVKVQFRGFSARDVKGDGPRPRKLTSDLQCFVPIWSQLPTGKREPNAFPDLAKVLLLGTDATHLDWLQRTHTNVESLELASSASIEAAHEALKARSFDRLMWIAPDVACETADSMVEAQEVGVLAVFRIAKALLQLGYADKELAWTLVTRRTQQARKSDPVHPAHAAIAGFVGSLAKEYPHWKVTLLDVDSLESVTAGECLSRATDSQPSRLAHRDGEWLQQTFAQVPSVPPSRPVYYKQKGVYVAIGGAGGLGEVWSRFMIEHFQARMVWIGRDELNATIQGKIDALARLAGPAGRAPLYIRADATDPNALQRALDTLLETYPSVDGVVHSAIVLQDQSVQHMEESRFRAGLSAKVDISVNLDRVFGQQPLDFMLFFSSILSFITSPGQSNYAAGCTFKDSFAQHLEQQRPYPVKIVNWGYWGNVGIVADDAHSKSMERIGIGSIEPREGMPFLQSLISSDLSQAALIKTVAGRSPDDIEYSEQWVHFGKARAEKDLGSEELPTLVTCQEPTAREGGLQTPMMDELLAELLLSSLVSVGLFQNGICQLADLPAQRRVTTFRERWLESSIRYLRQHAWLTADLTPTSKVRSLSGVWAEWQQKQSQWKSNADLRAQVVLLDECLSALPDILLGKQSSTDVMFPNSSMHLVEGIYGGNAVADYFNAALGETLLTHILRRTRNVKDREIRILEIGAGTGGTTASILPELRNLPIAEYCYTDVSRAFLMHAEKHYQPGFPALTTALFDVSKPVGSQQIELGCYDYVIATNVLHATPNIRQTVRHAKAVLAQDGVLLLNEISTWSLFSHLTFGLLEGWWLHEDSSLRLPGSPGLSPEKWRAVLLEEGFGTVTFPAQNAHRFGQQIVAARSDGWVRQHLEQRSPIVLDDSEAVEVPAKPAPVQVAPASSETSMRTAGIAHFQQVIASVLRMQPHEIEARRPFAEYGLDSILIGQLNYQLRKVFPGISSTLFFEVQTVAGLVDYLLENRKEELRKVLPTSASAVPAPQTPPSVNASAAQERPRPVPISPSKASKKGPEQPEKSTSAPGATSAVFDVAIVGLSGRYPRSNDLTEFWSHLANGRSCVTEIPRERWRWEDYYDADKGKSGKIYSKWGGFLDGIDQFDPLFFKIAPKEAKRMDPQERLFLQSCYEAIEDAGYTPESLGPAEKIGVFAGAMNARYIPQPAHYSIANRVSYVFNFQGPSMAVDTACSSSLTAVHLALESLYSGSSDCAIAGGVNLIIDPVHYMELSQMTMLSSGSECKSFGENADGFVDAEGVGVVVLKPLHLAERDGDHIYAVIKGSAVNAGGKTNGYTVPNPIAQASLVSLALERAKVAPEHVSYIEAHGTGTALGDPIEISGLTRAFNGNASNGGGGGKQYCAIGSLKSNIGHCESAAGIAGLTKVLLQLKHRQLVPSLHSEVTNSRIDFEQTPFRVQHSLQPWARPMREVDGVVREIPRIAGVSSFGAGGSNAHVIVQEYIPTNEFRRSGAVAPTIVPLSARTAEQLEQKVRDLLTYVRSAEAIDLPALAYTLQTGREAMDERLGMIVGSVEQLASKLQAQLDGKPHSDDGRGQVKRKEAAALFGSEADVQRILDGAIASKDLIRLLDLWVKGLALDWRKLYGESAPARLSLPTYPFAKERYWMDRTAEVRAVAAPATAILHPLLHTNTSELGQQRYSSTFTGRETFLVERTLPAGAYLEMARAAIEHASSERPKSAVLELREVVWAESIEVDETRPISVALRTSATEGVDFEIYSEAGEEIIHCQGRAVFDQDPGPIELDLDRLGSQAGDRQRLMQLRALSEVGELGLHPSLIEDALQAVRALIAGTKSLATSPRLPLELHCLRMLRKCEAQMMAWIRFSDSARVDVDLCDVQGRVCVQMRGISYPTEPPLTSLPVPTAVTAIAPKPKEIAMLPTVTPSVVLGELHSPQAAPVERKKATGISLAAPAEVAGSSAVSLYQHGSGVYSIRIATPDGNMLSAEVIEKLVQALATAKQAADLKALIINGAERCFLRGGCQQYDRAVEQGLFHAIVSFPCPVIAAMRGDATGAGFLVGTLADFMICGEQATYSYTRLSDDFYPTAEQVALFNDRFGEARAHDLLYVSLTATGTELRDKCWTCPIVPQAEVESYALELAQSLSAKSQQALHLLKQHLSRRLLEQVKSLTVGQGERTTAERPLNEAGFAARITSPSGDLQLESRAGNVLLIRIRDTQQSWDDLSRDLQDVFAKVSAASCHKVIVLASDCPEFLPAVAASAQAARKLWQLIVEAKVPVIGALSRNARGFAWLTSQFFDACIYNKDGRYSLTDASGEFAMADEAAAVFPLRFGDYFGKELLLTGGEYTGAELQRRVGALTVGEHDQVLSVALRLAGEWSSLRVDAIGSWKRHMSALLRDRLSSVAAGRAEIDLGDETPASLPVAPTSVRLDSEVISAVAHPEGILVIKMEDRQAKNMFSKAFVAGVEEAFAHIKTSSAYKAVILTGYDSYFACGGTQESLLAIQEGKEKFTDARIYQLAMECEVPVIAAMQGHGLGGGWTLGMFADFVVMSEQSRYVSPYMDYGFTPGAGATLILPRQLGADLAKESLLTARPYTGTQLRDRGLLLPVASRSEVLTTAMALAKKIAQMPRGRLVRFKQKLTRSVLAVVDETYRRELAMHEQTFVGQSVAMEQIQRNFLQIGAAEGESNAIVAPPSVTVARAEANPLPAITAKLKQLLAQELHMQESDVDEDVQFIDLGMDSIAAVTWVRKINEAYKMSMLATKVYSYPTLTQLARHIKEETDKLLPPPVVSSAVVADVPVAPPQKLKAPYTSAARLTTRKLVSWRNRAPVKQAPRAVEAALSQPIAVVGMAGQFPQARNLQEFWRNIAAGKNCISRVPAQRWDMDAYYSESVVAGKTNCQWMGALDEYDLFDPLFFNISPIEAECMDPEQRLFLQACWHSIEDAGYDAKSLSGSKCGVFVGCTGSDYRQLSPELRFSAQGFTGGANSILAARISYLLNLRGPCVSVDTACSSSLVALAQACDSLAMGNSDVALAGGVALMSTPEMHIKTAQAGMLSPDGRCFTFDQRANGFVPGEAVGVVMLKRLADAERDGDTIYGVIQGWGVNQDGKTNGITAPNPESQTRLQQDVYDKYQIDPAGIQLIEAHGTGTKLGDPIEVEGLKGSFGKYTQKKGYCALGSVKSNVGHCLAAAGIAGFIKLVLALQHRQLPPTVNFDRLNEHIGLADSPFYVNDRLQSWDVAETERRRAAISAFGFSGTNAHVVVAEPVIREEARRVRPDSNGVIVPLSARMPEQLEQKARELLDFISNAEESIDLVALAYTLQVGREAMEERLGLLVSSIAQLAEKLEAFLSGARDSDGVYRGQMQNAKETLSLFAQDADMKEAIVDRCIAQRQFGKLLGLWSKGLDLDWRRLYSDSKPKRMRLPLYPFAKQRYWIESSQAMQAAASTDAPALLHPLLHTNASDFTGQKYRSKFSGTEFFLRDHRVKLGGLGVQKVLPGVAYLEMVRAALQHAAPAQPKSPLVEISEFVWLKPVVVTEPREVTITLSRNDADDNVNYEISSEDAAGKTVHCQGFAAYRHASSTPRLDVAQLKTQMNRSTAESAALYEMFDEMGLQYGPAHRGITSLHLGQDQLLAQLRLPDCVRSGSAAFQLHPSLLDSALQASAGLIVDFDRPPGEPLVPFALASLRVFAACTEEMFAWLRYSPGSRRDDKVIRLDIDVCDRHGNVCLQMEGFSARVAENAASFDSAFYGRLLERIMSGEVSADDAAELG
ncbi:GNAT family N-acetyltransferase [Peristeroidobacter agariperforans]|uniref:GNAT family N-acetyltransferase n=1 Tax=Peristeroidobacter agariperforans TaxID=268404 RepID=UPI00101D8C57|nr:GNAT family N-acetyltransferase [Peristeroidobacter agariperforans]